MFQLVERCRPVVLSMIAAGYECSAASWTPGQLGAGSPPRNLQISTSRLQQRSISTFRPFALSNHEAEDFYKSSVGHPGSISANLD